MPLRPPGEEGALSVQEGASPLWWETAHRGPSRGRVFLSQTLGLFSGHFSFLGHRSLPSCPRSTRQDKTGASATADPSPEPATPPPP